MQGDLLDPARRTGHGGTAVALLAVGLVLLPIVVVVVPTSTGVTVVDPAVAAVHSSLILYSAARLVELAWRGEPRWMRFGFWSFVYSYLGLIGLAHALSGRNPLETAISSELALKQGLVVLAGLVAYDVAVFVCERRPVPSGEPAAGRVLSLPRVVLTGVLALVAAPFLVVLLGGFEALFSSRQAVEEYFSNRGFYQEADTAAGGTLLSVSEVLPFVALFALIAILGYRKDLRRQPLVVVLLALLVVTNLVLNNPISSPRFWLLTVVLAFLFHVLRPRCSRRTLALLTASYVLGATIAFPYLDAFRFDQATVTRQSPIEYYVGKTDYGSMPDIAFGIRYADTHGHTDGLQVLGAAAFWLPRSIWPDKPNNTAQIIADDLSFPNRNLDSPLWVEGYIDFGWVGTAVLLGLWGALSSLLDRRYIAATATRVWASAAARAPGAPLVAVLVPSLAGYQAIVLRGSLLQAMARVGLFVVLFLLLSRRRSVADVPSADVTTTDALPTDAPPAQTPRLVSSCP